ncbi:general secretion pathway protein GspL [Allosphingosinicella flava]|uniref:General secretion pathway protein GspL n=1 Tax=Allosphingosinicella flava TaxID=2771430 RepID=A0A7T2GHJ7_9SPHN|nr:type II secretion system protein GspL [Sphingosinicella flava]QPQ53997.1 general secretion pathway protein GspL [Sphingosinicella flava]
MSAALLIFLSRGGFAGWMQLADGAVVARGERLEGLPVVSGRTLPITVVVPGDEVSLHWAEFPEGLSEPQAQAAGRIMAADLAAQPVADLHVAVGPEGGNGVRCIALVSALQVAGWIARLADQGIDPDRIVPEPLLLLPPEEGLIRFDKEGLALYRGPADAFSVEAELAALMAPAVDVQTIDAERFEADLPAALDALPVNLRQGPFAKRRAWKIDWKRVRRMAVLGVVILFLGVAIQFALILRYTFAADAAEQERAALAEQVTPGGGPDQLDARLRALGGGARLTPLAGILFDAIRNTPNVQLSALGFDENGLRATILADAPGSIAAVQQQIASRGFAAEAGAIRPQGNRSVAELTMRPR